jgi:hypothetical protein
VTWNSRLRPGYRRGSATPRSPGQDFPPALPGDDFDELDEALGHNFVEDYEDGVDDGVEEHSGADADAEPMRRCRRR